jgi:hypothetical protein
MELVETFLAAAAASAVMAHRCWACTKWVLQILRLKYVVDLVELRGPRFCVAARSGLGASV